MINGIGYQVFQRLLLSLSVEDYWKLINAESKPIGERIRCSDLHMASMKLRNDLREKLIQREDIVIECV